MTPSTCLQPLLFGIAEEENWLDHERGNEVVITAPTELAGL